MNFPIRQVRDNRHRFLSWKLPAPWHPDGGIKFTPDDQHPEIYPTGTNLFDATQTDAMVHYLVDGLSRQPTKVFVLEDTVDAGRYLAGGRMPGASGFTWDPRPEFAIKRY